ncbi:dienelactone hydrolase family protein [Aurantivibrio infirmus]
MIEREFDIQTTDGQMNTFITHPEKNGPYPVIIFYMDAPGKREELHDMARRFATVGYYVILPNLYYRESRDFVLDFVTEESRERMNELMYGLSHEMILRDTQSLLDFLDQQESADTQHVGCVGYCMSGPFAMSVAAAYPDTFAAAASIYGVRLLTDKSDSPHLSAHKIKGELYIACAETDTYAPTEMVEELDQHLKSTGINYHIEWYPGTRHGFAFPQRHNFEKQAAERHWERLFALFKRNL